MAEQGTKNTEVQKQVTVKYYMHEKNSNKVYMYT